MKCAIIYGSVHHGNTKKIMDAIEAQCDVKLIDATKVREADLSEYDLIGFDTFGPFKLVGGIAKGHPNQDEIQKAVEFVSGLL